MDNIALLNLVARARKRAESGDEDIEAQHAIITELERKGLDGAKAREILAWLITAQDANLTEMNRLLDKMDNGQQS